MSGALGGGSKGGGGNAPPVIAGLQVSTSTYGMPIPIVWGQNKINGNLLWYGNFSANPVSSGGGGKGGGGSTPTSYNYTAAGLVGLCEGGASGIPGIAQIWNSKNATTLTALGLTFNSGTYPQTAWGYLTTNFPSQALGYPGIANVCSSAFQLSSSAQMPNILYEVQGLFRYGSTGQTGKNFTSSGTNLTSANHGFVLNQVVRMSTTGLLPSPLVAGVDYYVVYPATNTFYLATTPFQPTATSGNPSLLTFSGGSGTHTATPFIQGANPSDVITDFISNGTYGVNSYGSSSQIPLSGLSGSAGSFSNYCVANGIFISPALTQQQQASQFITEVCDITNSAPVWSQGYLTIIPYGDTPVTGNGVTFTPNTTVQFVLTDDDFLTDGTTDPIVVTRSNPADAFNQVQVGFPDRTNQYNPNIAQAQDQANIDLYGLRPMQIIQHDHITDAQVARNVSQVKLQRVLYIRNQYTFKLGWKYAQLEPMDLISLTDAALGFNGLVVRVIQVEEDNDEQLSLIAEDYLVNNATVQSVAPPTVGGATAMMNVDPGLSNTPVIFDAPGILTASGFELWMASDGGPNWGGAQVWVSTDNTTFSLAGTMQGGSRYGVTTTILSGVTDPDTVDTIGIDLTLSQSVLNSGSTTDADNHSTLALLNDASSPEVISYSTATLTGSYQYNLTTYIRRGVFNTAKSSHLNGTSFIRLDNSIFKYAYDPLWVGKTIYVKLLPLNKYGASSYTLSMLTATSYTIKGSISKPGNVASITCTATTSGVTLNWTDVVDADRKDYEVRVGSTWATASSLGFFGSNSCTLPAQLAGTYVYQVVARSRSLVESVTPAQVSATFALPNAPVVSQATNKTDFILSWLAVTSGFVIDHYEIRNGSTWSSAAVVGTTKGTMYQAPVTYGGSQTYLVAAINVAGNISTAGSATVTIAAPATPTVTASTTLTDFILAWAAVTTGLLVDHYEVRQGSTWATATPVATTKNTVYQAPVTFTSSQTYLVATVDVAGNIGSAGSATVTISPPAAPTLNYSTTVTDFVLNWSAVATGFQIDHYEIRIGTVWSLGLVLGTTKGTTYQAPVTFSGTQTYMVAAIDVLGNVGAAASVGVAIVPPSAPSITTQVIDNNVLLYWNDTHNTLPIKTFEVRRGAVYSSATILGTKTGLFTTIFETSAGTYTYWVTGIDTAGNYGTPGSVSATMSQPPDFVFKASYNSVFNGTVSNAFVSAGAVVMPVNTTETWATHFTSRSWTSPQNQISASYPVFIEPANTAGGYYEEVVNYGTVLASCKVTISPTVNVIAGSPVVTCTISTSLDGVTYTPYVGVTSVYATNFQYVKVRVAVASASGTDLMTLSSLNIRLDVKLKNDAGNVACLSTDNSAAINSAAMGGTTVLFAVPFISITSITLTPQGTTAPVTAVYDFIGSTINPAGFKVYLYNSAGARVSGTVSWSGKGY